MHHPTGRTLRRRGAALVEFALLVPLLFLFLLGIIEFAMIGHHKLSLTQGARAGSRQASIGKPVPAIKQTVIRAAPNAMVADSQIAVEFNTQDDGAGAWTPVIDSADGAANTVPFGRLIRVRVMNWPHRLVTGSFFSWLPGVRNNELPLSAGMTMRRE